MLDRFVDETCALLCYYAASSGHFLPTFRDRLPVPSSRAIPRKNLCCPETLARNYHYSLRNNAEERRFHLLRGGNLKSRLVDVSQILVAYDFKAK